VKVGASESPAFAIGDKILQVKTGADQLAFFKAYRSLDEGDRNLPIFGSDKTQNVYGGWFDASGDMGKHISHLSYAIYFNPQQIPFVAWAFLHAYDLQPDAFGDKAKEEAAWGADLVILTVFSIFHSFFKQKLFAKNLSTVWLVILISFQKIGRCYCRYYRIRKIIYISSYHKINIISYCAGDENGVFKVNNI